MEEVNWNDLEQNSVSTLKYVCQQHKVHPKNTTKRELIKEVEKIRISEVFNANIQNSASSSASSSREQSPVKPPQRQKNFNLIKLFKDFHNYLKTPNPTVITIALVCLITSTLFYVSFTI